MTFQLQLKGYGRDAFLPVLMALTVVGLTWHPYYQDVWHAWHPWYSDISLLVIFNILEWNT